MKLKQSFKSLALLLVAVFASTNFIWAQEPSGQTVYLAAFKAQTAGESSGSGTVKLTWVDAQGQLFDNAAVSFLNTAMPYATGNPSNGDAFASTAMVIGATLTATESIENSDPESTVNKVLRNMMFNAGADSSHLFMTPFAYFKADAQGDAGSYFAGWTFNDARVWQQDTAMDKSAPASAYFKVLPQPANVFYMAPPSSVSGLETAYAGAVSSPNNIYAVFNKYLLSNPTATSAQLEAVGGATTTLDVSIDVEGDILQYKEYYADFVFPSMPGTVFYEDTYGTWSWNLAREPYAVGPTTMRAEVTVTYIAKDGITPGTHTTSITVSMAGSKPSSLIIPLSVNALDPARPEALLLDGKSEQNSGTLAAMLAADLSGYTNPIIKLNKQHSDAITLPSKNFTFDLNGNEAGAITIAGGNVTIAYSKYGGSATSLTVNGGKAILNGGTFGTLTITNSTVEQNGATVTGAATNAGTLTTTAGIFNGGLTSSNGTLTLNGGTFNGTNAVQVTGGTAYINRGTLNGTSCGLLVSGGTATTKKLAVINSDGSYSAQRTGGTLNVECGKFGKPLNGTINFTSGYFKNQNYGVPTEGKTEMLISTGVEYNEGYRYFLGTNESASANGVGVCRIGTTSYAKLEDALAYANNNPSEELVIFMTNNYVLPAGYYTLPAKATLVVPMSDEQAKEVNKTAPRLVFNDVQNAPENSYAQNPLVEFRRLTFASGVNMDVFGAIEMTGTQYSTNEAYTSQPVGPYGHLVMEEGSHITLQSGAEIRAWGFMTGKGETDARRGSTVREMFQMGDWKGAMTSLKITGMVPSDFPLQIDDDSDKKIFPVTQYFIQNIESPVKYHPGALLSTSAAVSEGLSALGSVSMTATDIAIVGVDGVHTAIFLMDNEADADNTWVRKWYDVENDVQTYDINSGAHIGSMELNLGSISLMGYTLPVRLNSAKFDLPLTCNFKIHLLSGSMDFKQNTCLLPGAEVEVDKESTVSVAMDNTEKAAYEAWVEGGKTGDEPISYTGALYVYDAAEWDKYAYCNEYNGSTFVNGTAYTKTVRYAPSWNGSPTKRAEQTKPASAAINVHGTFQTASGFVYTSEHGANIFSSNEDAGTFIFNDDAVNAGTRDVYNVKSVGTYEKRTFYPARLKNGNNTYENTDEAVKDLAYCYQNNKWSTMTQDGCFMKENRGGVDIYYAKPAEYVALANGKTENADHTYSDADGAGRLFILMEDDCQWWEVENVDNLYHCIHPENDTYYEWNGSEWAEKVFYITWKNWDGTIIQTADKDGILQDDYVVTYGTMAEFLGTNPTREADIDYTYDFVGWTPELAPVTSDVTYTATYEKKERKYTIIFQNEGGTEIERQFLTHNAVPVCENMPTKVGHILTWTPAISPVIGDQTYVATWLEVPPTEWDVTFVNNANGELQETEKVGINAHPTYNGSTPVKENADHTPYSSDEYTYTFWGWSAVIDGVAQQFAAGTELPCPTAPTTYTAVYTETQKTYVVRFLGENGVLIPGEEYNLPYGAMPVCSNTPTKENTAEWTYGFAWIPQIQTVMASVDPIEYRATFPATKNKYTITLTSNLSGVCTFTGAGTFDYDKTIDNVAVNYESEKYTFDGWSDGETDAAHPSFKLTGNITLTANFTPISLNDKTIAENETWDVPENSEVKDLILTSDGSASGQMLNVSNLTIRGKAYFDLTLNAEPKTWYAFAVPWKVDATTGVSVKGGAQLILDNTYHVLYYDGANRAQYGKANGSWKFLADKSDKTLEPGTLYLIYLNSAANTLRFTKKNGASINNISVMVEQYPSQTGDDKDANWNGIANPAVYYAYMNAGVEYGQHYNDGPFEMSTHKFIVGEPIFVQTPAKKSVVADNSQYPASAPRRNVVPENDNKAYEIRIAPLNAEFADRIYVRPAEEKMDKYIIGKDLAKISVSTNAPQMWVNRYDAKLCVNTIEEVDNQATFPLGIYAPADGQYTISTVTPVAEDEELFITVNGAPVWNLAQGEYNIDLKAGNTDAYGLLLVREHQIPEVTTGCESVKVADKASIRKVLINGQVFIIRDGAVYTIFGQKAQ